MTSNLYRVLAGVGLVLGMLPVAASAQQPTTVSGRITNEASAPLQGATVSIPTLGIGAYSNAEGRYTFTVPADRATGQTATIVARRIGFAPTTRTVTLTPGATITQDVTLATATTQLEGVVVTALGMTREKSQLGTAQQQLSSAELNTTFDPNVLNQLAGKVSGVQITGSGTQGGSSTIRIRGFTSIGGNNEPLFVVDGMPVINYNRGGNVGGATGGVDSRDFGSTIADINPEDIATLSVLKGPNAAALYGSRASNGVIVITTKKGAAANVGTQVTTSVTWDRPSVLPEYQNLYGQGSGGEFQYVDGLGGGVQDYNDQSFGPRLDGRTTGCTFIPKTTTYDQTAPCSQFMNPGVASPWIAHPDNVSSFFNTGRTVNSTIAFNGGTERANARLSLSGENVNGIIPNSFQRKVTAMANGALQVNDRFSTTGNVQYLRNNGQNRPSVGYNGGILEQFVWFGRQVDMSELRNWQATDGAGHEYNWNHSYHNNPFWMQYANPQQDIRDRVILNGGATYKATDWLSATLRSQTDFFRYSIDQNFAAGNIEYNNGPTTVSPNYNGAFYLNRDAANENNTELLLNANREATSRISFTATAGANRRYTSLSQEGVGTNGILAPNIYNVANAGVTPSNSQYFEQRRVNSVYGSAGFTFNNYWTVEATARNDWSSTLPKANNSYFYPSLSTSLVLSDAVPMLHNVPGLNYLKLRASTARVGSDARPYQLVTTYTGSSNKFGGLPLFTLSNTLQNADLKPEQTTSNEGGIELALLDSRITLDASIYDKYTTDQIINLAVSSTSGFTTKALNAGKIDNHGFEALLTLVPLRTADFEWSSTINYTRNKAKVLELAPGLQTIVLGTTRGVAVEARVGEDYGVMRGYMLKRDTASGQLLLKNGLPQRTTSQQTIGSVQPDWIGGFNNTFRYKNVSLSTLLDVHRGGKLFSITNYFGSGTGVFAYSLLGREVDWNNPGIVVQGIDEATRTPNTTNVNSEDYWTNFYLNTIDEPFVYDASYVKLRELRLNVDLPQRFANRLYASSASIALIGRNLFTHSNVPNIDPEFAYSSGNFQGVEFATLPNPKSFGFSVRITP
jgi:TonB-linked SusC/RagA family outer membrane protein